MNLPTLAADKANHFCYGAVIASVAAVLVVVMLSAVRHFMGELPLPFVFAPTIVSAVAAFGFGWAKEFYDKRTKRGVYDPKDAHVTAYGGLPVVAVSLAWALMLFLPAA